MKSPSSACHIVTDVMVAVVKPGSSAGGSPMIATFTVPPFFGVLAAGFWPALATFGTAAASAVPASAEPVRLMKRRRVTWGNASCSMLALLGRLGDSPVSVHNGPSLHFPRHW